MFIWMGRRSKREFDYSVAGGVIGEGRSSGGPLFGESRETGVRSLLVLTLIPTSHAKLKRRTPASNMAHSAADRRIDRVLSFTLRKPLAGSHAERCWLRCR